MDAIEALWDAIEAKDFDKVQGLIQSRPDLVHATYIDEQPIHRAVWARDGNLVSLLISAGADVDARGESGDTPLHYAIRLRSEDMTRCLLSFSPSLTAENDRGFAPLLRAARHGEREIAEMLLESGATLDFHSAVALGRGEAVRQMLSSDPDVVRRVRYKDDLLPDAVYAHAPDVVEMLLANPAIDVHKYGLSGEPPLMAALRTTEADPTIVRLLLRHGADPFHPGPHGRTAMDRARWIGIAHLLEPNLE